MQTADTDVHLVVVLNGETRRKASLTAADDNDHFNLLWLYNVVVIFGFRSQRLLRSVWTHNRLNSHFKFHITQRSAV